MRNGDDEGLAYANDAVGHVDVRPHRSRTFRLAEISLSLRMAGVLMSLLDQPLDLR
jgi:hypothetical protein